MDHLTNENAGVVAYGQFLSQCLEAVTRDQTVRI